MMNERFEGFVLVGGKSSRMGADKFALGFRGATFLENAAAALAAVCGRRVRVVLNAAQEINTPLPIVRDVYPERGALGGIHAALENCETEFAVILAVDLPLVTGAVLGRLAERALSSADCAAVVPRQSDGRLQPLCAVYRAEKCRAPLEKLLSTGEKAAVRDFLALVSVEFVPQNDLAPDGGEDIFLNVNTGDDYRKLPS